MSITERSLQTFMLYLNGDLDGGTTNFVHEDQALYMVDQTFIIISYEMFFVMNHL